MNLFYLLWVLAWASIVCPQGDQLPDQKNTSILMVAPHASRNKYDWDVILGDFRSEDSGDLWSCFGGEVDTFFRDSLFGDVFSVSAYCMLDYLEANSVYRLVFPDGSSMFVVPFADHIINSYLTGFYDALYHQQRKTRYAKKRGISTGSVTKLAIIAWGELMDAIRVNGTGHDRRLAVRVASKRVRARLSQATFVSETICIDPKLWNQLTYIAHKKPYTKGPGAGTRVYA